jgi:hypothetical protein
MTIGAALRRAIAAARAPVDDELAGGLPWSALYPTAAPPAIPRPAIAPPRFRAVTASTTSPAQLAAANPDRRMLVVVNDSTAILYVKLGPGAAAIAGGYTDQVGAGGTLTLETPDVWLGELTGIWAAPGGGSAAITEL